MGDGRSEMGACRRILFFRLKDIFTASNKAFRTADVLEAQVRSAVVFDGVFDDWLDDWQSPLRSEKQKSCFAAALVKVGGLDAFGVVWCYLGKVI